MEHFIFFYFLLLTLVGVVLTALLVFYSYLGNNRLVDAMAVFYGFYTFDVSLGIFNKYLRLNMQELYVVFWDLLAFAGLTGRVILLWSIVYLLLQLITFKRSRLILAGFTLLLLIGFVYRGFISKTSITPELAIQFQAIDILDITGFLLFLLVLFSCLLFRTSVVEPEKRFLVHGALIILGYGFLLIVLNNMQLIPELVPLNSLVFVMFSVFLTAHLIKYRRAWRTNGNSEVVITDPKGLVDRNLTKREREILTLLIEEKSDEEISKALNISVADVKSGILSIYKKNNLGKKD